ncbi:hypothetical protein PESP_a3510 [Pseudoalteromonas espejiana DSM 9414]|nr:hypothetical protein PESP_a3510 [Pseudoalteromonas espejiana DSM 9414]
MWLYLNTSTKKPSSTGLFYTCGLGRVDLCGLKFVQSRGD